MLVLFNMFFLVYAHWYTSASTLIPIFAVGSETNGRIERVATVRTDLQYFVVV